MIDASAFALEENIRQTRAVVELAASVSLCVEGELGHLADAPCYDHAANADLMTQSRRRGTLHPTDRDRFAGGVGGYSTRHVRAGHHTCY